jgi:tetratricopeptide (TPR) repeat protein
MSRKILITLAVVFLVANLAAAQNQADPRKDYQETMAKYRAEKTEEGKCSIWIDFLKRNPDNDYTYGTVSYLVRTHYLGHLNDPAAAIKFIEEADSKVANADRKRGIKSLEIGVYGKAKDAGKLEPLSAELAAIGELDYNMHESFTEAAVEAEAWDLALEHADAALALATPEAIKADYAKMGREVDELRIEKTIGWRTGPNIAAKGWALINLGRTDEGLKVFEKALEVTPRFYVGVPDSNLDIYWAKTLLKAGDYDQALERIAPDAIWLGGEEATALLKEAYAGKHGGEAGFEEFLWNKRLELARTVDDFTLPDYDGKEHKYSDLKGKVTILSFWFPT